MYVLPNSIDFELFKPFPKKDNKKLRIGWTASASHMVEIFMVKRIMRRILDKYKVTFVILGDIAREALNNLKDDEIELHPFVDLSVYPLKIASLNLDIGIAPLRDEKFNRCKSQLKWSEYSALKIPSVVSDLEPYYCVEDGVTGMRAKTEDEFVEKMGCLIENPALRSEIAENAYQKNYEDFNLETNIYLWVDCYEDCSRRLRVYRQKAH